MKALDKDICARHPAMYAWIMRSGNAMGMTRERMDKAGIPAGDSIASQRLNALAIAYGYGDNTTQFLRDTVLGRLDTGFRAYEVEYVKTNMFSLGNGALARYDKYRPINGYGSDDSFEKTFREPKGRWRNAGHETYEVKGRLGYGKRKRAFLEEVATSKLPARRDTVRLRRKRKSRRRAHKASI